MSCFRRIDDGSVIARTVPASHVWVLVGTKLGPIGKHELAVVTKVWHCRYCDSTIEVAGEPAEHTFGVTAP